MKKAKILLLLLMCSMYQSCSSNEGNLEPQKEPQENFYSKTNLKHSMKAYGPKKVMKLAG